MGFAGGGFLFVGWLLLLLLFCFVVFWLLFLFRFVLFSSGQCSVFLIKCKQRRKSSSKIFNDEMTVERITWRFVVNVESSFVCFVCVRVCVRA